MFNPADLHGIIPPICTPLSDEGGIDTASTHRLVDFMLESGVHGIFALGSSGECAALTAGQRKTLLEAVLAANRGRVPVLVGIMDSSTARCIEHGLAAREVGADALVLSATYYYRTNPGETINHFRAVHAAVGMPIMAYDVPAAVHSKLESTTIKQLYEAGLIIGLKDSSGVTEGFRQTLLALRGTAFRAFTGSELIVDACLQMGAHGSVPGLANVFPAEYVQLYNLACDGDWGGAAALQERLLACFYELISQGGPGFSLSASALGAFKAGLKLQGVIAGTRMSAPFSQFGPAEEERVAEVMRRHGFPAGKGN